MALAAACGDGPSVPGGPTVDLVGTYTLTSVEGRALPYEMQSGLNLTAAEIVFGAGGRFVETVTVTGAGSRNTGAYLGDYDNEEDSRYVVVSYDGDASPIHAVSGQIITRTGRDLVRQFEGPKFVYTKQ